MGSNSKIHSWVMKFYLNYYYHHSSTSSCVKILWNLVYKGRSKRFGIKRLKSPSGVRFW